jgi:hypothetical protein
MKKEYKLFNKKFSKQDFILIHVLTYLLSFLFSLSLILLTIFPFEKSKKHIILKSKSNQSYLEKISNAAK